MPEPGPRKLFEIASRQDELCDQFEDAWKSGNRPKIEDFLERVEESEQSDLLRELLSVELAWLAADGKEGRESDYLLRFPDFPHVVRDVFENCSEQIIPETLGEYRIEQELGRGGMGVVYRALHNRLKRPVAIKALPPEKLNSPEVVARFHREMQAIGQLDDPHIVRAHDAGEVDGTHYLVMEFVDGLDLSDLLKRVGPLSVANACEIIRQAALGLQSASDAGLVHRDIKPSNLMLSRNGVVKLLDLGLAQVTAEPDAVETPELTSTGQIMGTFDHLAPEQASDTRGVDIRADVYALGCTLFKLLTDRAPYEIDGPATAYQRIRAHVENPIPSVRDSRPEVPVELDALLARLLAKRPEDRFQTPDELAAALERFCDGHDLPALLDRSEQPSATDVDTSSVGGMTVRYEPSGRSAPDVHGSTSGSVDSVTLTNPGASRRTSPVRRRVLPAVLLVLLVIGLGAYFSGLIFSFKTPDGTIILDGDPEALLGASITVDGERKLTIRTADDAKPVTVEAEKGTHTLKVTKAGFEAFVEEFTIQGGEEKPIRVRLLATSDSPENPGNPPIFVNFTPGPRASLQGLISRPTKLPGVQQWQVIPNWPWTAQGHGSPNPLVWNPSGELFALATSPHARIRLYDAKTLELRHLCVGHEQTTIHCLDWSPNGEWLASGGEDSTVRLWRPDGTPGPVFEGHTDKVMKVAWSPQGDQLASVSYDGTVRFWKLDGTAGQVIPLEFKLWPAPTGMCLDWAPSGERLVTNFLGPKADAAIIDANTGDVVTRFRGHDSGPWVVSWSPNGAWIATGGNGDDTTLRLWDRDGNPGPVLPCEGRVRAIAWSSDSQSLCAGDFDGRLYLWQMSDLSAPTSVATMGGAVKWLAWHPSADRVAAVSGVTQRNIMFWSTEPELTLLGRQLPAKPPMTLFAVDWNSDDSQFALAGGHASGLSSLWNRSGKRTTVLHPDAQLSTIDWVPSSRFLIANGFDQKISRWNADSGEFVGFASRRFLAEQSQHQKASLSPTGNLLAAGKRDGSIEIWTMEDFKRSHSFDSEMRGMADRLVWSPDEKHLAVVKARSVKVFDRSGTREFFTNGEISAFSYGYSGYLPLAWSPKSDAIAYLAPGNEGVKIVGLDGMVREVLEPKRLTANWLEWTRDDRILVGMLGGLRVWEPDRTTMFHPAPHRQIKRMAASNNGKWLVATGATTMTFWDAQAVEPLWTTIFFGDSQYATVSAAGDFLHGSAHVVEPNLIYVLQDKNGGFNFLKPSEFNDFVKSGRRFDKWLQ